MLTGLRRNELRSLRWSNVDFENGSITVESAYSKNGEVESVPLHPDLKKALKQLDGERKPAPEDKVFVNLQQTMEVLAHGAQERLRTR